MRSKDMLAGGMLAPVALTLVCVGLAVAAGCATTFPPSELYDARTAFQEAAAGPASGLAPHALARARLSLNVAEEAWAEDPDDQHVRDLAYVAEREAELATTEAKIMMADQGRDQARRQYGSTVAQVKRQGPEELAKSEAARCAEAKALAQREAVEGKALAGRLTRTEAALAAHEALARLSDIARLQEEERGTVVSISSDVLFATNEATLLFDAEQKLVPIFDALWDTGRQAVIEGHTDSIGPEDYNRRLSYRRAMAVKHFLVRRGIPAGRLQVLGVGVANPLGDNHAAEGRALNRRVDVIILKSTPQP